MAGIHKKRQQSFLADGCGKIILDVQVKKQQWALYIKELFSDDTRSCTQDVGVAEGPSILKSEVLSALHKAKIGKG
ncbi:hypothetical protein JYU34_008391, partial [Plutella xylostella]